MIFIHSDGSDGTPNHVWSRNAERISSGAKNEFKIRGEQ